MPLIKSGGKKAISANIRAETRLFQISMGNVLSMLFGMAVWAKNLKITKVIVRSIPVFMMDSKKIWAFTVPTASTFNNFAPSKHHAADCSEVRWFPCFSAGFVNAFSTAILPLFRGCRSKAFATKLARMNYGSLQVLCFVIAGPRTVFCLVTSGRDVMKLLATYSAIGGYLRSVAQAKTSAGTVFRGLSSISPHKEFPITLFTNYSNHGECYAFS